MLRLVSFRQEVATTCCAVDEPQVGDDVTNVVRRARCGCVVMTRAIIHHPSAIMATQRALSVGIACEECTHDIVAHRLLVPGLRQWQVGFGIVSSQFEYQGLKEANGNILGRIEAEDRIEIDE